jgi:hypothetical protein
MAPSVVVSDIYGDHPVTLKKDISVPAKVSSVSEPSSSIVLHALVLTNNVSLLALDC